VRKLTQTALIGNGVVLLVITLWLLVGGGRGFYGGGGASEVDGILLLLLTLFNLGVLAVAYFQMPSQGAALSIPGVGEENWRELLHKLSKAGLILNVALLVFVALWLLVSSGRYQYWVENAAEVDMILLLVLASGNVVYMLVVWFATRGKPPVA
jgi:hypothetical protein